MDIANLCQRRIVTIEADATLREAAVLMRERHVGALVVTDSAAIPRVLGIVTDRDLAIEVLAREPDGSALQVGDIASRSPVAVAGKATVQEAVEAMERHGVRRLLVTDDHHGVIGFVSADDLVEAIAVELTGLAAALRSGIARESAERAAIATPQTRPVLLPPGMSGIH
jgi:CBS domain-containing protein